MKNILDFNSFNESYLSGSRQPMYHMTTYISGILKDDKFISNKRASRVDFNKKDLGSNSWTRNIDFGSFRMSLHKPKYILEVDSDKLKNDGIKFYPVDEWALSRRPYDNTGSVSKNKIPKGTNFNKSNFTNVKSGKRGTKHNLIGLSNDPILETEFEERTYQDISNFGKYIISIKIESEILSNSYVKLTTFPEISKYIEKYPHIKIYTFQEGDHRKQEDITYKFIKDKELVNEEFKKIRNSVSLSGRTKVVHNILDEPSDPKSYSSNILLKDYLKSEEIDGILKDDEIFNKLNNKEKQKIRSYRESDKINQSLFNLKFLKEREESGDLNCEYCNKGPLIIYSFNPTKKNNPKFNRKNGATVDHKNPISRGGKKFDRDNLAVCCHSCNQKKSNMSWEELLIK